MCRPLFSENRIQSSQFADLRRGFVRYLGCILNANSAETGISAESAPNRPGTESMDTKNGINFDSEYLSTNSWLAECKKSLDSEYHLMLETLRVIEMLNKRLLIVSKGMMYLNQKVDIVLEKLNENGD